MTADTPSPKYPVFDGHNDVVGRYFKPGISYDFFQRNDPKIAHIDLPRTKEGGFAGGFFAVYAGAKPKKRQPKKDMFSRHLTENGYSVPLPPPLKWDWAMQTTTAQMNRLFQVERDSAGQFQFCRTVDEIEACIANGTLAAILHIEGAEAIDPDLNALEVFYQAGLRSVGPVWSRGNIFAEGVPFVFPALPDTGPGLTDAGKALVKRCNELGILIDLSHMNEAGFWDVAKLSDAPLVATHSNVHALCQSTRNLTDKQLDAIKESDGMVGLNFAVGFLREDGGNGVDTPLDVLVRHIDYLVERLGVERVGFGSDFDGATMPQDLSGVEKVQNLVEALRKAGYDHDALNKITHQNWLRVLRKTWQSNVLS
ncbi:MAG: dipeptidase [bacterium]|nr:dipeptidase [bacterium]